MSVEALLATVRGRGDLRRAAARLAEDPALRESLRARLVAEGEEPGEVATWADRKLIRRALGRSEAAQVVSTPTARDESFRCAFCGRDVPPAGVTARDHCPACLRSVHVDDVPGDRAAGCGGRMDPVGGRVQGDEVVLRYRCARCGFERNMRALRRGPVPDDWEAVVAALGRPG